MASAEVCCGVRLLISAWALGEPVNAALLAGVALTAPGIRLTVTR